MYTPTAKGFDEVGRFQKYTDDEVRQTVGFNNGYNRWMDNHIGVTIPKQQGGQDHVITSLDELRSVFRSSQPH